MDRLAHLNQLLANLEEQLAGLEKALTLAPMEEKARLRLLVQEKQREMQPYQQERGKLLAPEALQGLTESNGKEPEFFEVRVSGIVELFQCLAQAYQQGRSFLRIPYSEAVRYGVELLYRSQQIQSFELEQIEGKAYFRLILYPQLNLEDLRSQLLTPIKNHLAAHPLPISPDLQTLLAQTQDADPQRRIQAIEALGDYACGA